MTDISIVLPAYCEERRIGSSLDELAAFLTHDEFFKNMVIEVLIVAADAPDRTKSIVLSKLDLFESAKLLEPGPKVGKGRDVQFGMLKASGKFVIFMDADLATPLSHLKQFYRECESGSDVVIGVRDLLTYRGSRLRGVFSWLGNLLYRFITGSPITDTQCGFKMFTKAAVAACFTDLQILGWNFDLEVLARAQKAQLKVRQLPIAEWKDMPYTTFKDNPLQIAYGMTRDMIKIVTLPGKR